jgi:hypothetical protein
MSGPAWLSTFSVHDGVVHYHDTGARIRLDTALARDVLTWFSYYLPLRINAAARRLFNPGPKLYFVPRAPPPWYLIWNASAWIGARETKRVQDADAIVYFEDATWSEGHAHASLPCINGGCTDVSKSRVAQVFEEIFGYPLAVDPMGHRGQCVEKSELNGAHDGRIIACPAQPRDNHVYQRLIETGDDAFAEDLRTPCVGGEPVAVFVKRRLKAQRFANFNSSVALREPNALFSAAELTNIRSFAQAMALDWGGLDILRDRASERIYIVDVNKTDMPPLALPFRDKMKASRRLGRALDSFIATQRR